jgi:response regulator of citrate/malate metabolism
MMLSGIEDGALARSTLRLGALDYVTKPIDFPRLAHG